MLLVSVVVIAVCGLIYELLSATLSSYLFGDSVFHFSVVIGLFLSAMGVGDFGTLLDSMAQKAPLRRNVDQMDVGNTAAFLLSPLSSGITGQVLYVDAGYSILGI